MTRDNYGQQRRGRQSALPETHSSSEPIRHSYGRKGISHRHDARRNRED